MFIKLRRQVVIQINASLNDLIKYCLRGTEDEKNTFQRTFCNLIP